MKILHRRRLDGWLALTVLASLTARGDLLYHFPFRDTQGTPTLANFGTVGGVATIAGAEGSYAGVTIPYLGEQTARTIPNANAVIQVPSSEDKLLLNSTGDKITYTAWINIEDNTYTQGLIGRTSGSNKRGWSFFVHYGSSNRNGLGFRLGVDPDAAGSIRLLSAANTVPRGEWVHVAFSWEAGTSDLKFYVNGLPVAITATSLQGNVAALNTEPLKIGAIGDTRDPLQGMTTAVHVYGEILTQAQIVAIMQTPPGPPKGTVITLR